MVVSLHKTGYSEVFPLAETPNPPRNIHYFLLEKWFITRRAQSLEFFCLILTSFGGKEPKLSVPDPAGY
jgi:hypothetical protein